MHAECDMGRDIHWGVSTLLFCFPSYPVAVQCLAHGRDPTNTHSVNKGRKAPNQLCKRAPIHCGVMRHALPQPLGMMLPDSALQSLLCWTHLPAVPCQEDRTFDTLCGASLASPLGRTPHHRLAHTSSLGSGSFSHSECTLLCLALRDTGKEEGIRDGWQKTMPQACFRAL